MASKKAKKAEEQVEEIKPIESHPWEAFTIRRILRSQIKNAPYNPRKISQKAREKLAAGMDQLKLLGPLNWNERTGNLIGGHQRLSILDAHANGEKEYYLTVAARDLSEADEVAANLLLNNHEAQGDWDLDKLSELLKTDGLQLTATGFDAADIYNAFGDDIFTESTAPELEKLNNKLRTEREKHANIVKGNEHRDNCEFFLVIVFRDDVECGRFIEKYKLENDTYHSGEVFEKLMVQPEPDSGLPEVVGDADAELPTLEDGEVA